MVYFWAEWCKECRPISQTVDLVAAEEGERLKVVLLDVDENPRRAALHCIQIVPTIILFMSGKEQQRIEGLTNKKHLSSTIEMRISPNVEGEIQDQTGSLN